MIIGLERAESAAKAEIDAKAIAALKGAVHDPTAEVAGLEERADSEATGTTARTRKTAKTRKDILAHGAMALFETARTDVKVVHKEDHRQRLKQLDVTLQTMTTQAARKLWLAAEKLGKALAWFERGATAGKLTTKAQLYSALKEKKSEKQKVELPKAQINFRVHGYGLARFNKAWSGSTDRAVGAVADLTRWVKQMFADEKAEKLRPPSEPPVPDAATKRLKALGTLTIQASFSLSKRQASAGVMQEVAAQLQADKAAAAEATEVASQARRLRPAPAG